MRQLIIFLLIFFLGFPLKSHSELPFENRIGDQEMQVILRMVGHNFLLSIGDTTSRILPIEKIKGRYKVEFDREIGFMPDEVVNAIIETTDSLNFKQGYILSVEDCKSGQTVYSYQAQVVGQPNIIPCRERGLPKGCYQFFFTFYDDQAVSEIAVSSTEKPFFSLKNVLIALFVILFAAFLIVSIRKRREGSTDGLVNLGQYGFNLKTWDLWFDGKATRLSGKEGELLDLLIKNKNETVERDEILKAVWGDDGDYIGRTLDVFISKLRKKLDDDKNISIDNIRGVGYRLVIAD